MNSLLRIFTYVAYLYIPFFLLALYLTYEPIFTADETAFDDKIPTSMILIGFAISFYSLKDVKKPNKMSRYIMSKPRLFKSIVILATIIAITMVVWGVYIIMLKQEVFSLGVGLSSFGVGYLTSIKATIDQAKDLTDHY